MPFRRRMLIALPAAAVLAACGFQLRGTIDLPFDTLFVEGMPYSPFTGQLKRSIAASGGTRLSATTKDAAAIVYLMSEAQDRTILAVSGAGRVREMQLRYRLTFRVTDPAGKVWLAPAEVLVLRDMTYDDTQILAKEGEAQMLFKEMQNDAVQQVLRRIQAIRGASTEPEE